MSNSMKVSQRKGSHSIINNNNNINKLKETFNNNIITEINDLIL